MDSSREKFSDKLDQYLDKIQFLKTIHSAMIRRDFKINIFENCGPTQNFINLVEIYGFKTKNK